MKRSTFLNYLLIGFLIAASLGLLCLQGLRRYNENTTSQERRHLILFFVETIESGPYETTIQDPRLKAGRRWLGSELWVLAEDGRVLATNTETAIPVEWPELAKPETVHDLTYHYKPFRLSPDLTLVKLEAKENTYLLVGARRNQNVGPLVWVQITFMFFVLVVAMLIALSLIYLYVRRKSQEARAVLARLEKGDLKARFEIQRIDEIGSLMLDFNRMAAEIERLVHRVQLTESARKDLLSELSHDLRTPLTSLKTSIETLSEHFDEIPVEQQKEFLRIARFELSYFVYLIDDLFFIAELAEPKYKKVAEPTDVGSIIIEEVMNRQSRGEHAPITLKWQGLDHIKSVGAVFILGDPLLLQRLIHNAFDNAEKNAKTFVSVRMKIEDEHLHIEIENDGVAVSDATISNFGKRAAERTTQSDDNQASAQVTRRLGSVIMKTIAELHGGSLMIARLSGEVAQTRLIIDLPVKQ
jgi:signal transduction histidine kinase